MHTSASPLFFTVPGEARNVCVAPGCMVSIVWWVRNPLSLCRLRPVAFGSQDQAPLCRPESGYALPKDTKRNPGGRSGMHNLPCTAGQANGYALAQHTRRTIGNIQSALHILLCLSLGALSQHICKRKHHQKEEAPATESMCIWKGSGSGGSLGPRYHEIVALED